MKWAGFFKILVQYPLLAYSSEASPLDMDLKHFSPILIRRPLCKVPLEDLEEEADHQEEEEEEENEEEEEEEEDAPRRTLRRGKCAG